jgi:formate hydrogenlyase subunit 3/multisubunit Na+/H+ antiporter MnhD subunit
MTARLYDGMNKMILDALMRPISIPLLAGFLCLVLPKRWQQGRAWLAIAATALTLVAVWPVFAEGNQVQEFRGWPLLRVDALSGFVLLATAGFAVLIALYSLDYMKGKQGQGTYYACLLWSLAFSCGVLLANDLLVLLTCWGLLAVTLYLMIGLAGAEASEAARKTFIIVGGSDALLLLGTALLWVQHGSTRMDAAPLSLDSATAYLAFLCFAAAAFAKVGAMPLHSWLPDAAEKAYAPVTAYLPASLDKLLGIYLLARIVKDLFAMTDSMNSLLMFFGALTVLGGGMMALVQRDLKRLLAYCAISQVGYILLGIGTGSALGLAAGLFHMLNHAIYKSCLFLGAGVVEQKAGTVDLDRLGGLATRLPFTFAACLVASLAVSGIPPLNGFASKWMVYQAVIVSGLDSGNMLWVVWLAAGILGSALTLGIFVKMLHAVFLCKPSPHIRRTSMQKAAWPTILPMTLLAGLCVLFGVFAQALPLSFILPAVSEPVAFPGTWWPGLASGLLLLAFLVGWLVYAFTLRNGKLRQSPTYIGGEELGEAQIPGVPVGAERHLEVTGVDFYETVQHLPVLKPLYAMAQRKVFDLYESGGKATAYLVGLLRGGHTGLLPLYLAWFVLGLLIMVYVMIQGGR